MKTVSGHGSVHLQSPAEVGLRVLGQPGLYSTETLCQHCKKKAHFPRQCLNLGKVKFSPFTLLSWSKHTYATSILTFIQFMNCMCCLSARGQIAYKVLQKQWAVCSFWIQQALSRVHYLTGHFHFQDPIGPQLCVLSLAQSLF